MSTATRSIGSPAKYCHPQSNGHVESFNRTPLCMLTCYCENDQKYWDDILPQILMAYRSSVHASTGQTPFHFEVNLWQTPTFFDASYSHTDFPTNSVRFTAFKS
jgi:hypothetical protein